MADETKRVLPQDPVVNGPIRNLRRNHSQNQHSNARTKIQKKGAGHFPVLLMAHPQGHTRSLIKHHSERGGREEIVILLKREAEDLETPQKTRVPKGHTRSLINRLLLVERTLLLKRGDLTTPQKTHAPKDRTRSLIKSLLINHHPTEMILPLKENQGDLMAPQKKHHRKGRIRNLRSDHLVNLPRKMSLMKKEKEVFHPNHPQSPDLKKSLIRV